MQQIFIRVLVVTTLVVTPFASYACDDTQNTTEKEKTSTAVSHDIILYEILARPRDSEEEFIELYNKGGSDVDIAGWTLQDGSGKTFTLTADALGTTTLKGKQFFVIPQSVSKLYLNNDGDSVALIAPDGAQHDTTTFTASEEGQSWAFINNTWQWTTTVTKGSENKLTAPSVETKKEESGTQTTTNNEDKKIKETSNDIHLNELLPDPAGSDATDEWIAIINGGETAIHLNGWQLTDEKEYFTFGDMTIAPHEELVVEISESHINLNNDGDKIFLIDPFATIIEGVEYTNATEGTAWARFDDGWQWTITPTPGEKNMLTNVGEQEQKELDDGDEQHEEITSITSFRSLRDGGEATIEGIVTVLPGIFGSQYFYIQDNEAGVQVYSYSKSFPELAVGDRVRVHGEKSSSRNEARIKIDVAEDISVLEHNAQVTPLDAETLEESHEGMLVRVHGTVVARSSSSVNIDDHITVVLKSGASIDEDTFEEGAVVQVIGIVSQYDDTYRLMPRGNHDVVVEEQEESGLIPPAHAQSTTTNIAPSTTHRPFSSLMMGLMAGLVLLGSGLGVVTVKYHRVKRLQDAQAILSSSDTRTPTIFDYVKKE